MWRFPVRVLRLQSDRPAALQPRPNSHTDNSYTPLQEAARYGQREACELLLQLKADVNKPG
jgi:ankyrin repeat protein